MLLLAVRRGVSPRAPETVTPSNAQDDLSIVRRFQRKIVLDMVDRHQISEPQLRT
jgi:hypothetical protein